MIMISMMIMICIDNDYNVDDNDDNEVDLLHSERPLNTRGRG